MTSKRPGAKRSVTPSTGSKNPIRAVSPDRPALRNRRAGERFVYSEALLRGILDHSPIATWISDENGTLVKMNQVCRDLLRITDEEVVGKYNVLRDDIVEKQGFMPLVRAVFERGETARFTLDYRTSDLNLLRIRTNASVVLDVTISPVKDDRGKVTNAVIQHMDITERKRADQELRLALDRLALAQRAAGAGMWDWDMTTEKLEWSPELFHLFGLNADRDEASFDAWERVLHPEDRGAAAERIRAAIQNHERLKSDYRIVLPSGDVRWISASGDTAYDADGRPLRMSGICLDITERMKAEMRLQESRAQYEAIFEATGTATLLVEADTTIIMANRECLRTTGYNPEELAGTKWPKYVAPESLELMLKFHHLRREEPGTAGYPPQPDGKRSNNRHNEIGERPGQRDPH